jgi:hypothetical protein
MEFENGRTSWFEMPEGILMRRDGRVVNAANVQVGDWARILINQAVIGPGHIIESVRGMNLEGEARHISNIVRGQLTGIDRIQNQLMLQNAQQLEYIGWRHYQQIARYSLANPQIEFFYNGRSVSLAFVNENLRHSSAEVYVALENAHGGERIRMVSFRSGRDELLPSGSVVGVDGQGGFNIMANDGTIRTDEGTIVRRNGRLVDGRQISPWDHARVSLNGENSAAVVDIGPAPQYAGVQIARGRMQSIDQGNSFRTQSMSLFDGFQWRFTPIEREFAIDRDTLFINEGGLTDINEFIDFTPETMVDRVFNIVVDGSRAAMIVDAPYTTQMIRGTIFEVSAGQLELRDVHVRNSITGEWNIISLRDATATANIGLNTIIVDRNQTIGAESLQLGQQVRIMTPAPLPNPASGMEIDGFIVLVER